MALISRSFYPLTLFLGRRFRGLFGYTERDMELMYPVKEKIFYTLMRESGYMHIQSTKPDTVGECSAGEGVPHGAGGRRGPHNSEGGSSNPFCHQGHFLKEHFFFKDKHL